MSCLVASWQWKMLLLTMWRHAVRLCPLWKSLSSEESDRSFKRVIDTHCNRTASM